MKTWEVYKMLDEWNVNEVSPVLCNKANGLKYIFVYDGNRKGIKLADTMYSHLKTQYHFSLNGEWELINHYFDVGDIVVNKLSNKIHKIREQLSNGQYLNEIGSVLHENNLRAATHKEIKLMEKWHSINRNVSEFKKWDIIKDVDGTFGFHYREVLSVNKDYLRCTGGVDIHESNASLITPLERRFDAE